MPPKPPTRGSAPGPRWRTSVPQTPVPPPPNPGYATAGVATRGVTLSTLYFLVAIYAHVTNQQPPFYGHYTGQQCRIKVGAIDDAALDPFKK